MSHDQNEDVKIKIYIPIIYIEQIPPGGYCRSQLLLAARKNDLSFVMITQLKLCVFV